MADTAHKDPEMMEEKQDAPEILAKKIDKLVGWIKESKHLVVFTGAGVSTSAGIPDFRGPDGVWTLKAQGKQRKGPTTSTLKAFPTVCHMSLVELQNRGILKYLISQNCDGLHKRSGMLPEKISELHGNSNIEYCEACGQEYLRDAYAHRIGRGRDHYTGRHCVVPLPEGQGGESGGVCNGRLMESTIDFGQSLPERPLELADENSRKADLHIVFGSSLTVSPACTMPKKTAKNGGRLVIVNLQKTPLYDLATLNIRARCDEVMAAIMSKLQIPIPRWVLKREVVFNCQANNRECVLTVQGVDPAKRMLPASVVSGVSFKLPKKAPGILKCETLSDKEPFRIRLKYEELKDQKGENVLPLNVVLTWMGHYDEPDVPLQLPLPLGKNSTTRYWMGYTPSLGEWETKVDKVSEAEKKAWSPLMHSLMGTSLAQESKKEISLPQITKLKIQDNDEDMKSDDEEMKDEKKRSSHLQSLWTASAVCRNGKDQLLMYVFGGAPVVKSEDVAGISAYDVEKKTWLPARVDDAKLPFATEERWGHTATVCPEGSSNIYLIGGWDSSCQYGDTILYNAKTNELKKVETAPEDIPFRAGHSAVCVGEAVYVFGGAICKGGPYKFYNDVQVLDTKTKAWRELDVGPEKPAPRSQHSCVALGDSYLLVLGGYTGGSVLDGQESWCLDIKMRKWKRLTFTSDEKGPNGFMGLSKTDFRVRPATHTTVLLKWENGVGRLVVSGLCNSLHTYAITVRPALGTMEWKLLKSSLSTSPTGHSYVAFPKAESEGMTVVSFGGLLNEKSGEPGAGRSYSFLRTFDVL